MTTAVTDQDPDDDPVSISCAMTATRTSARNVTAEPIRLPLLFGVRVRALGRVQTAQHCNVFHRIRRPRQTVDNSRSAHSVTGDTIEESPSLGSPPGPRSEGCTVFDPRACLIVISGDYDDQYSHSIVGTIEWFNRVLRYETHSPTVFFQFKTFHIISFHYVCTL